MKRETRYVVLKIADIEKYLGDHYTDKLHTICNTITAGREKDNKQELDCVVVENDWPEYESTWAAIAARVDDVPLYKAQIDQNIKYNGCDG